MGYCMQTSTGSAKTKSTATNSSISAEVSASESGGTAGCDRGADVAGEGPLADTGALVILVSSFQASGSLATSDKLSRSEAAPRAI